uniref:Calcineurin-like phosphoesterase domain-containing protein n=1 Tax=Odontella aurita TaxID=265563 RepID=A0A7S4IQG7_9STRA
MAGDGYRPEWGNYGRDSGGECGVPAARRFVMPASNNDGGSSNGIFWYSYDHGLIHTVVISSEHDLSPGSPQYGWLESDLRNVDRATTPFLVVESHRPLYNSEDVPANALVSSHMRRSIETLLRDRGVDLFLAGHYHAYLRACAGLYRSKCDGGGPVHITVGSAGAELDRYPLYEQDWTESFIQEWGYGRITAYNATALKFEFVSDAEGDVRDTAWILKD